MPMSAPFAVLAGGPVSADGSQVSRLESLVEEYELSYQRPVTCPQIPHRS